VTRQSSGWACSANDKKKKRKLWVCPGRMLRIRMTGVEIGNQRGNRLSQVYLEKAV